MNSLFFGRITILVYFLSSMSIFVFSQDSGHKTSINGKELNADELKAFETLTKQKLDEFQTYLQIISNKEKKSHDIDLAIKNALKLFTPEAEMEVSYQKNDKIEKVSSYPMKKYFFRLKALPYSKVQIKFYNIAYVGSFLLGPDGRYYATATIFQEFKGFNDNKLVYTDKQVKQINIVMEFNYDDFYKEWQWTVLLDDIKVVSTTI